MVKLVSLTQSFVCTDEGDNLSLSPEELIAYCARVSNPTNQMNIETTPKLLAYCIRNKHWSIFEQVSFAVEIKTSRAIAQQILRHRSFCFQEFSQRYAAAQHFVLYTPRRQDDKNRQSSHDDLPSATKEWFVKAQKNVVVHCKNLYQEALDKGIAKECARFLLPLNTETTLYMNGSVRSWIHYLQLRTDPSTQLEHREVAVAIKEIFCKHFHSIAAALEWVKI